MSVKRSTRQEQLIIGRMCDRNPYTMGGVFDTDLEGFRIPRHPGVNEGDEFWEIEMAAMMPAVRELLNIAE